MPNRILREGILTSERIERLDWAEEVFYRRLMSVVDDFGRYYARPALLLSACYPLMVLKVAEADIDRWLTACERADLVQVYLASDGKTYVSLKDFRQQVRSNKSKFPEPDAQSISLAKQMRSTCVADATQTPSTSKAQATQVQSGSAAAAQQVPIVSAASAHLDVSVSEGGDVSEDEDVIPPGAIAPAPPKGDALPKAGNPASVPDMGNPIAAPVVASEPAEAPAAPIPPAAPVAPPVAPPAPPAGPAPRRSIFAEPAARSRAAAKQSARDFEPPRWVPADAWARWLDYREEMAGGHTQWDFTVSEMKDVIRTLELAMTANRTSAAEELDATIRKGIRKPEYFFGASPTPPPLPPAPPPPFAPRVDPVLPVRPNRRNPAMHRPGDVSVPVWEQWCEFRRRKKAPVTELVVEEVRGEAAAAGLTLDAYLTKWLANGTTGFQAGYIKPVGAAVPVGAPRRMTQHEINSQRGAAFCEPLAPKLFGEKNEAYQPDIDDVEFRDAVEPKSDPYKGF